MFIEIWEGRMELRNPVNEAFWTGALIIRRIMILHARCKDLMQLLEVVAVDDFAHLLLCCDVCFFAHDDSLSAMRCKLQLTGEKLRFRTSTRPKQRGTTLRVNPPTRRSS